MTNPNDKATPEVSTHGQMHESGMLYGDTYSQGGLTKREHFAAMAMQGLLSTLNTSDHVTDSLAKSVAIESLRAADALIEVLNKQGE